MGPNSQRSVLSRTKQVFSFVPKNLNVYWLSATGLGVWFLLIHTPVWLSTRMGKLLDFPFVAHLVGVVGIYAACMFNSLVTPSWNKQFHIWVGRVGFALGYWGFAFGVYITWGRPGVDLSFGIFITIGGIAQMICQVLGYRAIKKYQHVKHQLNHLAPDTPKESIAKLEERCTFHLMAHVSNMLGLFVCACGIPAAIRAVGDDSGIVALLTAIGALNILATLYVNNFYSQIQRKNNSKSTDESSPLIQ